ncbi:hypothetical protein GOODEAATRI_029843, partial [Goodea atripinnis]
EGAVVALFKICRQDRFRDLYAHALRTVASICCVEEGINQLDKVNHSYPQTQFSLSTCEGHLIS